MTFGPISVLPNSFPNLFGLTGQAVPKGFEEVMQPVIDMLPFVAVSNCLETIGGSPGTVSVVGAYPLNNMIVPDTEAWLVLGASAAWTTLGTELLRGRLISGKSTSLGLVINREYGKATSSLTDAAGASECHVALTEGPILLGPKDFIGIAVEKITTAGLISIFQQASILRFTV